MPEGAKSSWKASRPVVGRPRQQNRESVGQRQYRERGPLGDGSTLTKPKTDTSFTTDVAELYESTLVPLIFRPYARDLAERARDLAPSSVLEIACGTGVVTLAEAKVLIEQWRREYNTIRPQGRVTYSSNPESKYLQQILDLIGVTGDIRCPQFP